MEDIKKLREELADLGASIGDMIIAYAKIHNHKPEFLLQIIGENLALAGRTGNFDEYTPKVSGVVRSLDNEQLSEFIADTINENKDSHEINIPSPLGGYMAYNINSVNDIENALNDEAY